MSKTRSEAALVVTSPTGSAATGLPARWQSGVLAMRPNSKMAIRQSGHMATMLGGSLHNGQCCTVADWRNGRLAEWSDGSLAMRRGGKLVICHGGDLAQEWFGSAEPARKHAHTAQTQPRTRAKRC